MNYIIYAMLGSILQILDGKINLVLEPQVQMYSLPSLIIIIFHTSYCHFFIFKDRWEKKGVAWNRLGGT